MRITALGERLHHVHPFCPVYDGWPRSVGRERGGPPGVHHRHGAYQAQYSYLVATVIGSAVIPTTIATGFLMPTHLIPHDAGVESAASPQR